MSTPTPPSRQDLPTPPPKSHSSACGNTPRLDPLMELEARIARRADEIAATHTVRTPLNLFCWLQAEQEVLSKLNLFQRWRGEGGSGPAPSAT